MIKFLHVMLTVTAYVSLVLGCSNVSDSFCIEQDTDSTFVYCSHGRQGRVDLMRDSLYRICHYVADSLVDVWAIRDSVYQFDCGDLDNDSVRRDRVRPALLANHPPHADNLHCVRDNVCVQQ